MEKERKGIKDGWTEGEGKEEETAIRRWMQINGERWKEVKGLVWTDAETKKNLSYMEKEMRK